MSLIDPSIVQARQNMAAQLRSILQNINELQESFRYLKQMKNKISTLHLPLEFNNIEDQLTNLEKRVGIKTRLFESGQITITIAGIEKSGKTTFLKTLTDIDSLPADAQRCTSVPCELMYPDDNKEIEIIYHSEESLLNQVIIPSLGYLSKCHGENWEQGYNPIKDIPKVHHIDEFKAIILPTTESLTPHAKLTYGDTLQKLINVQKALQKHRDRILQHHHSRPGSLNELFAVASHVNAQGRKKSEDELIYMSIIERIRIYKDYKGNSSHLRLCDTPGIDDPNPLAQKFTLRAVEEETDLLLILNCPRDMPTITGPLAQFLEAIGNLDPDSKLTERSIFVINWHKTADPERQHLNRRKELVINSKAFKESDIADCDAIDKESVEALIKLANQRLSDRLGGQDLSLIQKLTSDFKSLQAKIRLDIFEPLKNEPLLSEPIEAQMLNQFKIWYSGNPMPEKDDMCFIDRLRTKFNETTYTLNSNEKIKSLITKVGETFKAECKKLEEALPDEEEIQKAINAGKSPTNNAMNTIGAAHLTNLVEAVSSVMEDVGPMILNKIVEIIKESGKFETMLNGQKMTPTNIDFLFKGQKEDEQYASFIEELKKDKRVKEPNSDYLLHALEEFSHLSSQMRYVFRHELRVVLNMWDQNRWSAARKENLINDALKFLSLYDNENMDPKLRQVFRSPASTNLFKLNNKPIPYDRLILLKTDIPNIGIPAKHHVEFLQELAKQSIVMIQLILHSNANSLERLIEDYFSQATLRLTTHPRAEQGWENLLSPKKRFIFENEFSEKIRLSEYYSEMNAQLKSLEKLLN